MLCHKTNLGKFESFYIIQNMFSDHKGMKLEINNKRKSRKFTKKWKLSNIFLTAAKQQIRTYMEMNEN